MGAALIVNRVKRFLPDKAIHVMIQGHGVVGEIAAALPESDLKAVEGGGTGNKCLDEILVGIGDIGLVSRLGLGN